MRLVTHYRNKQTLHYVKHIETKHIARPARPLPFPVSDVQSHKIYNYNL